MSAREEYERIKRLRAPGLRMSVAQKRAVLLGSSTSFATCRQNGTSGTTMEALMSRGLARVERRRRPWPHMAYRLTEAGADLKFRWEEEQKARSAGFIPKPLAEQAAAVMIDALYPPVEYERVKVRCEFCGWEFDDGTDGGGCGRCGMTVRAVA